MNENKVLLAVHQGIAYKCSEFRDGAVDLIAPPGTVPSGNFERLADGTFVQRISASLPEALFEFVTRGIEHPEPVLGYVAPDAESVIWQVRFTMPLDGAVSRSLFPMLTETAPEQQPPPSTDALVTDLSVAVVAGAPIGWQRIEIECRAAGQQLALRSRVTFEDGRVLHWSPPAVVCQWFHRMRMTSYQPGAGSWFTANYTLDRGKPAVMEFGTDLPEDIENTDCVDELRYLPRHPSKIPAEMARMALAGHETYTAVSLSSQPTPDAKPYTLMARTFDGTTVNDRLYAYRPALSPAERERILAYLNDGEVVLASRGLSPDLLDPQRPDKVPMLFLTDGKWVWAAAVGYYLQEHGIPPAPDFVEHIRSVRYRIPRSVPRIAMDRASAMAMGRPETEAAAWDDYDRAGYALRDMATRFRVSRRHYSIGRLKDQAWCMVREGDRWAAFWYWESEDRRELEHVFDIVSQAATYIIGQLWQNYPNLQREPGELIDAWEVLTHPIAPAPPLDNFEQYQYVTVSDIEVEQFGAPTGNVVYAPGTRFDQIVPQLAETSPAPRRLQLTGEWTITACLTKPDGDRAGGVVAYILPQATEGYLKWGQIVELSTADGA
jgi:hypothetical protein